MKVKKLLFLGGMVAMAGFMLTACGSSTSSSGGNKNNSIVFIPKLTGNSYFEAGNVGAQEMAKKVGFKVKYSGNAVASVSNQVTIINNAVQQGANAIAVSSVDPTGLDNALKQATKQGLKVVTWDSDVSPNQRSLMVAQGTPTQLGQMLVQMTADALQKRGINPNQGKVTFAFHYSSSTVQDQNSWVKVANDYIKAKYPNWVNVYPSNYYSNQDAQTAINVGQSVLSAHKGIDAIICPDSTALPGQLQAVQNAGMSKKDITVTGFSTPNSIKSYAKNNIIEEWGLWNVKTQAGMAVYLANWLSSGHTVKIGENIDIPGVGKVKIQNNSILSPSAKDMDNSGVVLLPKRTVFTVDNVNDYNF